MHLVCGRWWWWWWFFFWRREGEGERGVEVVVVVLTGELRTCLCRYDRTSMHLIGWQNTWEQAPGVPATPSPP